MPDSATLKPSYWKELRRRAHQELYAPTSRERVLLLQKELQTLAENNPKVARRPEIKALLSLAHWRVTDELQTSYRNLNEARVQIWEFEKFCPVFEFQLQFLDQVVADYPNAPGPQKFRDVYASLEGPFENGFDDTTKDFVILRRPGATRTIVGFSGHSGLISGMGWTMFDRAIVQKLNANLIIIRDLNRLFFLSGVRSIGSVDQTISHLREVLEEFSGTTIVATGGSGGVFGALFMSSQLGIDHVVASSGPTSLDIGIDSGDRQSYLRFEEKVAAGELRHVDLVDEVNRTSTLRVDFFVAGKNEFDMKQMMNLAQNTDVVTPHIYADEDSHNILSLAILDGTFLDAFPSPLAETSSLWRPKLTLQNLAFQRHQFQTKSSAFVKRLFSRSKG